MDLEEVTEPYSKKGPSPKRANLTKIAKKNFFRRRVSSNIVFMVENHVIIMIFNERSIFRVASMI